MPRALGPPRLPAAVCLGASLLCLGPADALRRLESSVPCGQLDEESIEELEEYGMATGCAQAHAGPTLEHFSRRPSPFIYPLPTVKGKKHRQQKAEPECERLVELNLTAHKRTPEDEAARATLLEALNSGEDLADVLFTSRHRCCKLPGPHLPVPAFLRKFDWLAIENGVWNASHPNPRTVFIRPAGQQKDKNRKYKLFLNLPDLRPGQRRMLAIGDDDTTMVHDWGAGLAKQTELYRLLFTRVATEGKDLRSDIMGTLPMGLNNWYLALSRHRNVRAAIGNASLETKSKGIFAAWGKAWPVLDEVMPQRGAAERWLQASCLGRRVSVDPQDYWAELSRHHFQLSVPGWGIQSSKLVEALLVLTIPIALRNPALEDLTAAGWPVALVDEWSEITPTKLAEWQRTLAPHLEAFRLRLTADGAFQDVTAGL